MNTCWFHFTQAVKKHVKKFPALVKLIQSNPEASKIYYKLKAIPLLPKDHIKPAFSMLKSQAVEIHRTLFNKFLKYYEQQWLKTVSIFIKIKTTPCFDWFILYFHEFGNFMKFPKLFPCSDCSFVPPVHWKAIMVYCGRKIAKKVISSSSDNMKIELIFLFFN